MSAGNRIKHQPHPREVQQQLAAILSGHRSRRFRPPLPPVTALASAVGMEAPESTELPPTLRLTEAKRRRRAGIGKEIRRSRRLPPKSLIRRVSRPIESLRITVRHQTRGSRTMSTSVRSHLEECHPEVNRVVNPFTEQRLVELEQI